EEGVEIPISSLLRNSGKPAASPARTPCCCAAQRDFTRRYNGPVSGLLRLLSSNFHGDLAARAATCYRSGVGGLKNIQKNQISCTAIFSFNLVTRNCHAENEAV